MDNTKKSGQDKHSVVKHYIALTDKLHNSRPVWRQEPKRSSEKNMMYRVSADVTGWKGFEW